MRASEQATKGKQGRKEGREGGLGLGQGREGEGEGGRESKATGARNDESGVAPCGLPACLSVVRSVGRCLNRCLRTCQLSATQRKIPDAEFFLTCLFQVGCIRSLVRREV